MNKNLSLSIISAFLVIFLVACSQRGDSDATAVAEPESKAREVEGQEAPLQDDLAEQVARMGAIGYSYGGVFSPDGKRIAFVTNASGVPNVWMADADGSELRQVTNSEDQVGGVSWSPSDSTLAIDIAPGGGLNSQIYLMPTDGNGWQRHANDHGRWQGQQLAGWLERGWSLPQLLAQCEERERYGLLAARH